MSRSITYEISRNATSLGGKSIGMYHINVNLIWILSFSVINKTEFETYREFGIPCIDPNSEDSINDKMLLEMLYKDLYGK